MNWSQRAFSAIRWPLAAAGLLALLAVVQTFAPLRARSVKS